MPESQPPPPPSLGGLKDPVPVGLIGAVVAGHRAEREGPLDDRAKGHATAGAPCGPEVHGAICSCQG